MEKDKKNKVPTLLEMETAIAMSSQFHYRKYVIVPNISWGMHIHECDLFLLKKSGYAIEIEIKRSKSDLKKDSLKKHGHNSSLIKELYFAIPECLEDQTEYIPQHAGIISIRTDKNVTRAFVIREPQINRSARKLNDKEMFNLVRLGTMRIWSLKTKVIGLTNDIKNIKQLNS